MQIRTDLALEQREMLKDECKGVQSEEISLGDVKITRINIVNEEGAKALNKPIGNYITVELPPFSDQNSMDENRRKAVSVELKRLLPDEGTVLVAGLGNSDITPDSLGPKAIQKVFATRHINGELAESVGLGKLRPVAAVAPGVLGKTGIETAEILCGIVNRVNPSVVIVIDALASRRLSRLGCTVQISDTGIFPGSGVGNHRNEISKDTLGVPVISIGVPTVVDAATLARDIMDDLKTSGKNENIAEDNSENNTNVTEDNEMMVTPREIDTVIDHAAGLLSLAINCTLHPHLSPEDLMALV